MTQVFTIRQGVLIQTTRKTKFPDKNSKNDQLKCTMFYENNCKDGSDHGSLENWDPKFQHAECWEG